jgi:hypothetical protein
MCWITWAPRSSQIGSTQRWGDRWALDVSADLATIIETSWAREDAIPPHHIYLNIAYHLSTEARAGLSQFRLPAALSKSCSSSRRAPSRSPPATCTGAAA